VVPIPTTVDVVVASTTVVVGRGAPPPIFGIGVVTVFEIDVVVARPAVVVGPEVGLPPFEGKVPTFGSVVNVSAAFF
jgi:hypothetical protein